MKKVVFLPLDERPCNYLYPQELPLGNDIQLVLPPSDILGKQKKSGDVKAISAWVEKECADADYALLSMDTLLYSGIVPSRLHHSSVEDIISRIEVLRRIKKSNPSIKIYVHELIMRTPSYNLATEEPDYFWTSGLAIYKEGVYRDKDLLGVISQEEKKERIENLKSIQPEYLNDFLTRRQINLKALIHNLELAQEGVIDFFLIPQDDCSPYGYTATDRREVLSAIKRLDIQDKVIMHPGADEAGLTLISRCLEDVYQKPLKFYVEYDCEKTPQAIPEFESQPIDLSITSQIVSTKAIRVDDPKEADIVLLINAGGAFMWNRIPEFQSHFAERDVEKLCKSASKYLEQGKLVAIGDVALCNRGDLALLHGLYEHNLLGKITSYAGWNTSSNTLGTTIANAIAFAYSHDDLQRRRSLICRYLEDLFYMADVRVDINDKIGIDHLWGEDIHSLNEHKSTVAAYVRDRIKLLSTEYQFRLIADFSDIQVRFVWNRTFEIEVKVTWNEF